MSSRTACMGLVLLLLPVLAICAGAQDDGQARQQASAVREVATADASEPAKEPPDVAAGRDVRINRVRLTGKRIAELEAEYGVPIVDGRYWLDAYGNLGVEGGGVVANLRIAAAQAYGSATGAGGTAAQDGEGGSMFFAPQIGGKSVFWYSGM